jgi:hypothetical protein
MASNNLRASSSKASHDLGPRLAAESFANDSTIRRKVQRRISDTGRHGIRSGDDPLTNEHG